MQRSLIFLVTVLCALMAAACGGAAETPVAPSTAVVSPSSEATTAGDGGFIVEPIVPDNESGVLRGRALLEPDGDPLPDTTVALAQVTRQGDAGAFVLNTASSPMNVTDIEGYFIITNVPPGEFVMVVGDPYGVHEIIENPDTREAQTYFVEAGQVTEVGEIRVTFDE